MDTSTIRLETGRRPNAVDITAEARAFCDGRGDGLLVVFVPHATAGIAVFETGSGTESDLLATIDRLLPADQALWQHRHGSPGHGRDHVLPAFVSPSVTIPVSSGRPMLGTWQSIVVVDSNVDNPIREIHLSFVSG